MCVGEIEKLSPGKLSFRGRITSLYISYLFVMELVYPFDKLCRLLTAEWLNFSFDDVNYGNEFCLSNGDDNVLKIQLVGISLYMRLCFC